MKCDACEIEYGNNLNATANECEYSSSTEAIRKEIWNDLHASIKNIGDLWETSRILNAIPSNASMIENVMYDGGTAYQDYNRSIKDLNWLNENGQCMDNIKVGTSTISDAGRGAFATRRIPEGGLVSPAPLIHVGDIDNFVMFTEHVYNDKNELVPERQGNYTWQVLLNYCFGHQHSTLILCPYGLLSSLINHSKDNYNTKIQWSASHRMRHPHWLNQSLDEWTYEYHTGLQLDFVATRDINKEEEILIDYGTLWQAAWDNHASQFQHEKYRSSLYMPSYELNQLLQNENYVLRTESDREYELDGVRLHCRRWYIDDILEKNEFDEDGHQPCSIIQKIDGFDSYVVRLSRLIDNGDEVRSTSRENETIIFFGIPRDAFFFIDLPYSRDIHQDWAFRHPMMIPDEIFPDIWKNKKNENGGPYPHYKATNEDRLTSTPFYGDDYDDDAPFDYSH